MSTEVLTLEFVAKFTPEQEAIVRQWLQFSRPLWNFALGKLVELDTKCVWAKNPEGKGGCFVPAIAIWSDTAWKLSPEEREQGYGRIVPIRPIPEPGPELDAWMPMLKTMGLEAPGGLSLCARSDLLPFPELAEMPSSFRMGVLAMLDTSWQEWRKAMGTASDRGMPKFKRKDRDEFSTLYSRALKDQLRPDPEQRDVLIGVPKIGPVSVPGLSSRWLDASGEFPKVGGFRIVLGPDGVFRIQLSGKLGRTYSARPSQKAIGVDPGIVYRLTHSDAWRRPEDKDSIAAQDAYISSLQRRIDHKIAWRFWLWVSHPQRQKQDVADFVPISEKSWAALRAATTLDEAIAAIGNNRYQRIRHRLPKTRVQATLEKRLKSYKRKQQARAKSARNKWATATARKYGALAIESGLQDKKLRARPKPKKGEAGWEANGATQKSRINKRLSEAAPGANIAQLERMAKRYGRVFVKEDAPLSTVECPVCGAINLPDLTLNEDDDRLYSCACGWHCDQDLNAAINFELRAFYGSEFELTDSAKYAISFNEKQPADRLPTWRLDPKQRKKRWEKLKQEFDALKGEKKTRALAKKAETAKKRTEPRTLAG